MARELVKEESVQENSPLNTLKTVTRPPVKGGLFLYTVFSSKKSHEV